MRPKIYYSAIVLFFCCSHSIFGGCFDLDFLLSDKQVCFKPTSLNQLYLESIYSCDDFEVLLIAFDEMGFLDEIDQAFDSIIKSFYLDDFGIVYAAFHVSRKISFLESFPYPDLLYYYMLSRYFDVRLYYAQRENRLYVYGKFRDPIHGSYKIIQDKAEHYYYLDIEEEYHIPHESLQEFCPLDISKRNSTASIVIEPSVWYGANLCTTSKILDLDGAPVSFNFKHNPLYFKILAYLPRTEDYYRYIFLSDANKKEFTSKLPHDFKTRNDLDKIKVLTSFVRALNYGVAEREINLYPDQTLISEISDCEDRVLLLASLIKEYTTIETGYFLGYGPPLHHAVLAIKLPKEMLENVATTTMNGEELVLIEATGRNFEIGETEDALKSSSPSLISILFSR